MLASIEATIPLREQQATSRGLINSSPPLGDLKQLLSPKDSSHRSIGEIYHRQFDPSATAN
jgi:hypothetical protein